MSQVHLGNNRQAELLQQMNLQENNNAEALSHLSDTDRATAEIFLKGASAQEALKHTKWSLAAKIVSGIFTFGIAPALMCRSEAKKEKQLAADIVHLKDSLKYLDRDPNIVTTDVRLDGRRVAIDRDANGVLTATIGGQRIISNYNARTLVGKIEDDIVENTDLYGTKAALDLMRGGKSKQNAPAKAGHIGKSLLEQYNEKLGVCEKLLNKAEAAVKANTSATELLTKFNAAQSKLNQLQQAYNDAEGKCNVTIRRCDMQLEAAEKAQSVLDDDIKRGAIDEDGARQKAINAIREPAQAEKTKAVEQLRQLQAQDQPALYKAMDDLNLVRSEVANNRLLSALNTAKNEKETLTENYHAKRDALLEELRTLEASPERNTPAGQAKISALKMNLAGVAQNHSDPTKINSADPKDVFDSMGVDDTRHRDLCLKAIKAHMGIDGGSLHGCTTRYLDRIARYAIEGYYGSAANLIDHVLKITSANRITAEDSLELMRVREQEPDRAQKVNVAILRPKKGATATQQEVANFAADLIFSGNLVDEDTCKPEDRMRKVLMTNASVIGDMIKVEAGLKAVNSEVLAKTAEEKANKNDATHADKLEAMAARAEANAAQFAAKTLRGNILSQSMKAVGNFFMNFFGGEQKKVDEKEFTGLESKAYAAEAKALREELEAEPQRVQLEQNVAQAQQEVQELPEDSARLSSLVDAQKALSDFESSLKNTEAHKEAYEARLAVRQARADAKAKLTESPEDKQKADNLRKAIADPNIGAEFDVAADTALGERLTQIQQLPENERESLLNGVPEEIRDEIKDMLTSNVIDSLIDQNVSADVATIGIGITQLKTKDLRTMVNQINENVTKAAAMVQEEMTVAILMMDATLSNPSKVVVRELKTALEADKLPLTRENAEALLAKNPLPQALSAAVQGLSDAVTGVDSAEQRVQLASKVAVNAFVEYVRLAQEASSAQNAELQAINEAEAAKNYEWECRQQVNKSLSDVHYADEALMTSMNQAEQSHTLANKAEELAKNQEIAATEVEKAVEFMAEGMGKALQLEADALQAEKTAESLEEAAAKAKNVADEAELKTLVAGSGEAESNAARAARAAADAAETQATNARKAAENARALSDKAIQDVGKEVFADAKLALESTRKAATQAREQATQARNTANIHQEEVNKAKIRLDEATATHAANMHAASQAKTAQAQAEAKKTRLTREAFLAKTEAEAALTLQNDNQGSANVHASRLEELNTASLDSLVAAAGTDFNSDGFGKFIKFAIQDYFQSMPLADKRAMVSAGLRYAPANATPMQKLGAMLKGAGPVLQKIFQGLDGPGLPRDLRIACQDMRSRLAPIPADIVEANLLDMVNKSNGRIRNIEVLSSLGAASIGQAFRCRLTDNQGQSRECVVKILRPDAAYRALREKQVFEKAAAKVPGMAGTFRGQMEGIMEELDFGIEAKNASLGVVYDKPFNGENSSIQSVKVVEDIPPSSTSMAMEIANGSTLDTFLRDVHSEIERMGQNLGRQETFNDQGIRIDVSYDISEDRLNELIPVKARLQELYKEAAARHKQLTALADVWVTEGIFGEQGFFHGDLHAGNIMSDGKKLTVIDFGNATNLTYEQQSAVITMIVATTTRQSSKFLEAFREMLPTSAQTAFDSKKQQILESVRIIMQKGDMSDTGSRIAAIISEIQRNGVEIPHAIFNFSNSQIRLQNSINEMISLMNHIEAELRAVDSLRSIRTEAILPYDRFIEQNVLDAFADPSQSNQSVLRHIATVRAQIQDPNSDLSKDQLVDLRTAFSFITYRAPFKVQNIDNDPAMLEIWNANQEALENPEHPDHERAISILNDAMREKALARLDALEAEELKDPSRGNNPDTFLDVMGDVVEMNSSAAVKKLGLVASTKYGVTTFIHEKLISSVQPKI